MFWINVLSNILNLNGNPNLEKKYNYDPKWSHNNLILLENYV